MRILVLEDDHLVASAVERMLRKRYEVIVTFSSSEALALLTHDQSFDLILCDMNLGPTSGRAFYGELGGIAPALLLRVLFMTGGTNDPSDAAFLKAHIWLQKPFKLVDLDEVLPMLGGPRT